MIVEAGWGGQCLDLAQMRTTAMVGVGLLVKYQETSQSCSQPSDRKQDSATEDKECPYLWL